MSVKAIYFIVISLLFALFASINLGNTVTVNLGFKTFTDIPVFLFALFSFLIGFLFTLPFFISSKNKPKNETPAKPKIEPAPSDEGTIPGIQEVELKGEKKNWFQRLKEKKSDKQK